MEQIPSSLTGHPRFRELVPVARGSFGVVFRAFDLELGRQVALKTLQRRDAAEALALKQEFRTLRGLVHPNVVRFHELFTHEEPWFYTMDYVAGRPVDAWWRDCGDPARLEVLATQLLQALRALHADGTAHRDVKPANLLVGDADELTIVDFGFARSQQARSQWQADELSGSLAYMAPEVFRGSSTPSSDWFSAGTVLFELLHGRLPPRRLLLQPRRPLEAAALPPAFDDLRDLATSLLAEDPVERERAVEGFLAARCALETSVDPAAGEILVGRDDELLALTEQRRLLAGAARVVEIEGPSGIGKSALLRRFLQASADDGAVVLQGRCHSTERVPYAALDEVIDDLARYLGRSPAAVAIERRLPGAQWAALAHLFPVLERTPESPPAVATRSRELAVEALRGIFSSIAADAPLLLVLEDLHWGDEESAALLSELMRQPAPPLLLLLSYRWSDSVFLQRLELGALPRTRIRLGPLGRDALTQWLGRRSEAPELEQLVDDLVARGEGSPFLIQELFEAPVRAAASSRLDFRELLRDRVRGLEPDERALLDAAVVAGRPIDCGILAHAARLAGADAAAGADGVAGAARLTAEHLAARSLVQLRSTSKGIELRLYHDRIREALSSRLAEHARVALHRGMATALEAAGTASEEPEPLFVHWLAAGDRAAAGRYAELAAERAADVSAFERSMRLQREAVDLAGSDAVRLRRLVALAAVQARAGRCQDAVESYGRAAELRERIAAEDVPSLQRLATLALHERLRSGEIVAGAGGSATALPSLLRRWARRATTVATDEALDHARELASFASWRLPCAAVEAADAQLVEAARSADAAATGRALALAVSVLAEQGNGAERRVRRLLRRLERSAPEDDALLVIARAWRALQDEDLGEAASLFEQARRRAGEAKTVDCWQRARLLEADFDLRALLGGVARLAAELPQAIRDADARGDRAIARGLRGGFAMTHLLAADDPSALREELAGAEAPEHDELRALRAVLLEQALHCYESRFDEALDCLRRRERATMPAIAPASAFAVARVLATRVLLRLALAERKAVGAIDDALDRDVLATMASLRDSGSRVASALALQIESRRARLRGEDAKASDARRAAVDAYRGLGLVLHAEACELHGDDGTRRAQALARLEDLGILSPSRFAMLFDPVADAPAVPSRLASS